MRFSTQIQIVVKAYGSSCFWSPFNSIGQSYVEPKSKLQNEIPSTWKGWSVLFTSCSLLRGWNSFPTQNYHNLFFQCSQIEMRGDRQSTTDKFGKKNKRNNQNSSSIVNGRTWYLYPLMEMVCWHRSDKLSNKHI